MTILRTPAGQARSYRPATAMGAIPIRTPSGQAMTYRPASMGAVDASGNIIADPVIAPAGSPVPGNCGAGSVYGGSYYGSCVNACPPGQGYNATGICTPFGAQGMSTTTMLLIGGGLLAAYLMFVR